MAVSQEKIVTIDAQLGEAEAQISRPARQHARSVLKILATCAAVYAVYSLAYSRVRIPSQPRDTLSQVAEAFETRTRSPHSQKEVEELYTSVPDPESARAASRRYATRPHVASSPGDFLSATDLLKVFQDELGIPPPPETPIFSAGSAASREATLGINKLTKPNAWIDTYYPLMNTPLDRSLSIMDGDGNALWEAELEEDGDPRDPDAAKHKDAVPVFHGFSADGEVEGPLIYANYGLKEDYDAVLAAGGNFTGKIVLARYGANFRGLKIKRAEELGAAGVLMYSDPRDDGPVTVANGYEPYPAGPARNPHSVQRGSVQYLSLYPGDPTTPGAPAYPNATRVQGGNVPRIPSLPISWAHAQRLLREIDERGVEDAFVLDGKTSRRSVRLVNHVHNRIMPIWNTMAVIPGHFSNETVIIGNHRDAWVMGAVDPTSGTVSLHEVVRGFGALLRKGWKPLRNIVFASWDAEEYGLIGSTEWAEDFPEWISDTVVAYINIDGSAAGSPWIPTGSPSLAHLIRDAALALRHPTDANRTLWDARNDLGPFRGPGDSEFLEAYEAMRRALEDDVGIAPLGSGSDFTPFLQRLGVASMDETFNLSPTDAAYHYHSIYDTEMWKEKYADPGFEKHVAVAKHLGLVILRLADSTMVPLNTTHYALELEKYLDRVKETASTLGISVDFANLTHEVRSVQLASLILDREKADAERALHDALRKLPGHGCKPHGLLGWLKRLLELLPGLPWHGHSRREFEQAVRRVQKVNAKLRGFERGLISEEGLEGREWYRHLGVAPGKWLGYGATTFPAITEALTIERNATLAEKESERLADLLDKLGWSLVL
ncbi:Zn-dependent exopeptidase [Trametes cingulata]|nr:Zn-dependent exopeptidase [Trametes cingulata]